jgi:5'-3' exonuclease
MYATGPNNFRYGVYPEYKAHRGEDPTYRAAVKQYAVDHWGAVLSDGCEADDLLGIDQCQAFLNDEEETMIVTIDKDLDMIPGWHYFPGITRKGVVVKPPRQYLVSPTEAIRFFYYQMLIGDPTDNIKGVHGIGPKKAKVILEGLTEEADLLAAVREQYSCDEEMVMNGQCLWIWRKQNDIWRIPETTERKEQGQSPTEVST